MLQREQRPTAIFAASDTQALGVLAAAHEAGLNVPDDLSVIGYDDIEAAEYVGLTTISQELVESGLDLSEASELDADNVLADEESARVLQAPD